METRDMTRVLVNIKGENGHSPTEREELKRLLQELLEKVGESGTFTLNATSQRLQGRSTLQGVSIAGMPHNCIVVAYQPNGNDSRFKYCLTVALEKLESTFEKLKKEAGTAYRSKPPKLKKAKVPVHKAPVLVAERVLLPVATATSVPRSFKELTRDEDWLLALRIKGFDLAKQYPKGRIPKDAATKMIREYEGSGRRTTGPLISSLIGQGVIEAVDDAYYVFVETEPAPRQHHRTNTAMPHAKSSMAAQASTTLSFALPFLGNQVVLDAFLRAMGVNSWKPKVLSELLRQQYREWSPQRTGHVFRHMVKLGLLGRNTAGNYFVINRPQEGRRMPLDTKPNLEKLAVDNGTFALHFVAKQSELPRFPLQKIKAELLERLGECGPDFEGTYEVVVGEVDGNIPGGFAWRQFSPGTKGRGFQFGSYSEDGCAYEARAYTLKPAANNQVSMDTLSACIDDCVVTPPNAISIRPKKAGPNTGPGDLMHMSIAFLKACTDAMQEQSKHALPAKQIVELMCTSTGIDEVEADKQIRLLKKLGFLRDVYSGYPFVTLLGFGQRAAQLLPEDKRGLAGFVVKVDPIKATPEVPTPSGALDDLAEAFAIAQRQNDRADKAEGIVAEQRGTIAKLEQTIENLRAQILTLEGQLRNSSLSVEAEARKLFMSELRKFK